MNIFLLRLKWLDVMHQELNSQNDEEKQNWTFKYKTILRKKKEYKPAIKWLMADFSKTLSFAWMSKFFIGKKMVEHYNIHKLFWEELFKLCNFNLCRSSAMAFRKQFLVLQWHQLRNQIIEDEILWLNTEKIILKLKIYFMVKWITNIRIIIIVLPKIYLKLQYLKI